MCTSRPHTCELHSYCNELRLEEKYSDVIIKVEDRTFPCHRIILASALQYFRSMFSANYDREATQKEVEIKGVKAADFELLLTHIYGGSVELGENNVYRLLRISNYVGLERLSMICEEYVIRNKETISLDTVLDVFVFASKSERISLVNELAGRIAQDFDVVAKEEKLLPISRTAVEKILDRADLVMNRMVILNFMDSWSVFHPFEADVFDSWLIKLNLPSDLGEWIKDKLKKNKISLTKEKKTDGKTGDDARDTEKEPVFYDEFMDCDEFSEVQPDEVLSSEISLYCKHYEAGSFHRYDFDTKSNRIQADGTGPYYDCMKMNKIIFLKSVRTAGIQLLFACHQTESWKYCITPYVSNYPASIKKYLAVREYASVITSSSYVADCGTNIYFYNDDDFTLFNAELDTWTYLERKPLRTKNANLISYQNNLYLLGGTCVETSAVTEHPSFDSKKFHNLENGKIFQHYDPREGIWSRYPRMTHCQSRLSSCVYNDVLYATGGGNVSYIEGLIQCYDFKAGKWRIFEKNMPKPKQNHTVIGYNDQLYFIGGDNDLTWYSYDLKKEIWSDVLSIQPRGRTRSSVHITKILDAEVKM